MLINIKKLSSLLESEIKKLDFGTSPASLYDPLYYIMEMGGKRIRPLLALLSYSLYKSNPEKIIKPALAIEVFHNFTLMHDDIMDNAPLRRGNTTVHEKWDPNVAILSGDVMLIKAYEQLMDVDSKKLKTILNAFNSCATLVCEGQQLDMDFESRENVSVPEYIDMIKLKTAVLLGLSLELGAILADAPQADCEALRNFGFNIGIGFQLKDDVLDVYADQAKFGKQVGGDIIANKKTLLLIEALQHAKGNTQKELKDWIDKTEFNPEEKVKAVVNIYNQLNIKHFAEEKMNSFFTLGLNSLTKLSAPKPRVAVLKTFTQHLINREK